MLKLITVQLEKDWARKVEGSEVYQEREKKMMVEADAAQR